MKDVWGSINPQGGGSHKVWGLGGGSPAFWECPPTMIVEQHHGNVPHGWA